MKYWYFLLLTFLFSINLAIAQPNSGSSQVQEKSLEIVRNFYASLNLISDSSLSIADKDQIAAESIYPLFASNNSQIYNDFKPQGESSYALSTFINEMINNKFTIKRDIQIEAKGPYIIDGSYVVIVKVKCRTQGKFYDSRYLPSPYWMDYYIQLSVESNKPILASLKIYNSVKSTETKWPNLPIQQLAFKLENSNGGGNIHVKELEEKEANLRKQQEALNQKENELNQRETKLTTKESKEQSREQKKYQADLESERLVQEKIQAKSAQKYSKEQAKLERQRSRKENRNNSEKEYEINGRTVIKHYLGIALGTAHPILEFASANRFSGTTHSGFGQMGFSASIDGAFRIRNGVGVKLKADALSFNFNTSTYERNVLYPNYVIQNKSQAIVTKHYYLVQNLMAGFNFNMGKYKFLFEVSIVGGITTGFGPNFKYESTASSLILKSDPKFFVGYGYQAAGAFRIRCTSTFAVKIGACYMESRIPNYTSPSIDNYGYSNNGTLIMRAIVPQISLVGMFFHQK